MDKRVLDVLDVALNDPETNDKSKSFLERFRDAILKREESDRNAAALASVLRDLTKFVTQLSATSAQIENTSQPVQVSDEVWNPLVDKTSGLPHMVTLVTQARDSVKSQTTSDADRSAGDQMSNQALTLINSALFADIPESVIQAATLLREAWGGTARPPARVTQVTEAGTRPNSNFLGKRVIYRCMYGDFERSSSRGDRSNIVANVQRHIQDAHPELFVGDVANVSWRQDQYDKMWKDGMSSIDIGPISIFIDEGPTGQDVFAERVSVGGESVQRVAEVTSEEVVADDDETDE